MSFFLLLNIQRQEFQYLIFSLSVESEVEGNRSLDVSLDMINKKIQDFDQKIIMYEYPLTEKNYYMLINTAFTSVNKFQNAYNENELNYMRVIISELAESNDFHLNPIEVINLTSKLPGKGITKNRAQQLLDRFIMNGYFFKQNSKIYFGPKMITEFKDYLLSQFPDNINSCSLCKGIAIWVRFIGNFLNIFSIFIIFLLLERRLFQLLQILPQELHRKILEP